MKQHTTDELKHVEFLHSELKSFREVQDSYYKDLTAKITFLGGFTITVLTVYGTYAIHVNGWLKNIALVLFAFSLIILSIGLRNRQFKQAAMADIDVDTSDYFNKVYQAVSDLKKACDDNEKPLRSMGRCVRWSARIFIMGMMVLVLSFCVPEEVMINFNHASQASPSSPEATH